MCVYSLELPISDLDLYLLVLGVYTLRVYTLGVYSLVLPISDLELYLLALGVYSLGVYALVPRISDLELYMPVLKKRYRGPFKPSLFRELINVV